MYLVARCCGRFLEFFDLQIEWIDFCNLMTNSKNSKLINKNFRVLNDYGFVSDSSFYACWEFLEMFSFYFNFLVSEAAVHYCALWQES